MGEEQQEQQGQEKGQEQQGEQGQQSEQQQGGIGGGERTFTQAELDAIVKREKSKAEKAAAEKAQADADKAKLDETERLKVEKAEAEQAAAAATKAAAERIATSEAKVAALAAGANPERLSGVLKLADLSEAVDESGEPNESAIKAAIATVKKDYPELFGAQQQKQQGASAADFSQGGGGVKRYSIAAMTELASKQPAEFLKVQDDYLKARTEGRVDP